MSINEKSEAFPMGFMSPEYHNSDKSWYLITASFKKTPSWGREHLKFPYCFFREIVYVDKDQTFEGLGRSYMPINFKTISILKSCINPFSTKPLGVVLRRLFKNDIKITIISQYRESKVFMPYRNNKEEYCIYKRAIYDGKDKKLLALAQEEIMRK